ncbi:hypothetical protein [Oceanimonas sp. CAM02]|uniref:hypothetical protein n=1 Tax=Oceanimonas sp. CAM02 TaxID=3080336 RepID=UPI002935CC97|nr:hypothetical protein [Oceanimonas sp. CAM02]MDV2858280.1 hypothetical protein [Oceanimonas sp. CAM02]
MRPELDLTKLAHYRKQIKNCPAAELARIRRVRQQNLKRLMTMPDSELNIIAEIPFDPRFL